METNDIKWVKQNWAKGYRSDALGLYPDATGHCKLCGKKWIVVKGKMRSGCDCKYIRKAG